MNEPTSITHISTAPFDHLELFYRGEEVKIALTDLPFVLGRDSDQCQLVIDHLKASRQHCTLTLQDNQVGLLDKSTNGTSLQIGRASSIMIKNGFYPLTGQGYIQLGKTISANDPDLICYKMVFKHPG
ncbi:MAG: FHA domain-containing protein [Spongiibacteraceae bacterium]|jgi:pSer/pThr/pTyr-binding forkhead associated (FHA) protein